MIVKDVEELEVDKVENTILPLAPGNAARPARLAHEQQEPARRTTDRDQK
jgi:hypothetical protein